MGADRFCGWLWAGYNRGLAAICVRGYLRGGVGVKTGQGIFSPELFMGSRFESF